MTTQTSFSEKKRESPNKRLFNARFFSFKLKTGWPLPVVFVFIFILTLVVPAVSFVTDTAVKYDTITYEKMVIDKAVEMLYQTGAINVVVSMGMGLIAGLTCMSYINKKPAINFYHSLPIRREALFLTSSTQGLVYYLVSFITGLGIVFAAFSLRLGEIGAFVRPILMTLEYGVLFFFLVYSMALLAASLTGTAFMRAVGTGYILFLPITLFAVFVAVICSCSSNHTIIDPAYYINQSVITTLVSPMRVFNLVGINESGMTVFTSAFNKEVVIVLLTALAFFGVAFFLYCVRPSESTTRTVIWRPAVFVFKYTTIFVGASIFGMIFDVIFSSVVWMIFGIIFGAVVTFMLVNGILHKSARAIFSGIKGFLIFMVVMAAITTVFYLDVFGMFSVIPNGTFVNRVEVDLGGYVKGDYSEDVAIKVTDMIGRAYGNRENEKSYLIGDRSERVVVENIYSDAPDSELEHSYPSFIYAEENYNYTEVKAVFHTKIGIPYAVRIYMSCEDLYDLAKFMCAAERDELTIPTADKVRGVYFELYLDNHSSSKGELFEMTHEKEELIEIANRLSDPLYEKAESPIVGHISMNIREESDIKGDITGSVTVDGVFNNYVYTHDKILYITAKDYEILNELKKDESEAFTCEEDVIRYFISANDTDCVYVLDNTTGKQIELTETDAVAEVMGSVCWISNSSLPYQQLIMPCPRDHRYSVYVLQKAYSGDDYMYLSEGYSYCELSMRKDALPERVADIFAAK